MTILNYIYYRMAHAYMNYGWSKHFSYHCSAVNVGVCILTNIISIIYIIAYLIVGNLQRETMKYIVISCSLIVVWLLKDLLFKNDEDSFYDELHLKYKVEKCRIIKGCFVFVYYVFSILSMLAIMIIVMVKP